MRKDRSMIPIVPFITYVPVGAHNSKKIITNKIAIDSSVLGEINKSKRTHLLDIVASPRRNTKNA